MSSDDNGRMSIGQKIRDARKERGLNQAELGEAIGVKQNTISDMEAGKLKNWQIHAAKIARALNKPRSYFEPDWLASETEGRSEVVQPLRSITRRVPIMGTVEAGTWREVLVDQLATPTDFIPVDLPEYARASLCAFLVSGNSMNLYYPAGTYVVAIPAAEAGVQYGDRVIVRRDRAGLTEMTVKELVQEGPRAYLWPRSTDPDHQTPIPILPSENDQDAPVITHVVVASYSSHARSGIAFRPELVTE